VYVKKESIDGKAAPLGRGDERERKEVRYH